MYVVLLLGRIVCDLVLGEATWTLPVLLVCGVWMLKLYFEDLRELERVRAKAREVGA